jgi:integrase
VFFNEDGTGLIQVLEGKSRAARRMLPMTPRVYELLWSRYESSGRPSQGWIFPSGSKCGHYNGTTAKDNPKKALADSGVKLDFGEKRFVPYTLRHTALTNLGEKAGDDPFVLARIAGHSTITITQRYIHPQADAINRVFATPSRVGTGVGTGEAPKLKDAKSKE